MGEAVMFPPALSSLDPLGTSIAARHDRISVEHCAARRGFLLIARWMGGADGEVLRLTVRERKARGELINNLRITPMRARQMRVALAYALAEADGAPLVMVAGEEFALAEAEALDTLLADAVRWRDAEAGLVQRGLEGPLVPRGSVWC